MDFICKIILPRRTTDEYRREIDRKSIFSPLAGLNLKDLPKPSSKAFTLKEDFDGLANKVDKMSAGSGE